MVECRPPSSVVAWLGCEHLVAMAGQMRCTFKFLDEGHMKDVVDACLG
jgi:hypothetical protein